MSGQARRATATSAHRQGRLLEGASHGRLSGELMLVVTVLLWSFGYTASRYGLTHGFEPLSFAAPRWAIGAVVFIGVVLWRERSLRVERRDLPRFAVAILAGVLINQAAYNYATSFATAALVALVFGTLPVFASIIAQATGHATLSRKHWLATCISFGGVGLVAVGSGGEIKGDLGGILLALGAVASFAAYSVTVAPLMQRYSPLRVSAVVCGGGAPLLALVALPNLIATDWGSITGLAWASWAYIVSMFVVTTILWFTAISRVGAPHATLWANMQPFLGAVFAVLVLDDHLGPIQIAGAAVIGVSIVVASLRRSSPGEIAARPD
ncbi:MAG: DMT family transporter [Thermoleophilia bacterium]